MGALLSRLLDETAMRTPEAEAVRCDGASLTYQDLARRAFGLAAHLRAAGLEKGGRVAVFLGKSPRVPVAFHGVLAAGGALVPIDPRSPAEQVVRILRATGAHHLVTEPAQVRVVREALPACPEVRHVLGLAREDTPGAGDPWDDLRSATADRPPDVAVADLDPAYILHTSGSTGLPKLILHTQAGAMSFVQWAVREYGLTGSDRLSNHSSHHTCFATFDLYAAARAGAATVLLTPAVLMMPASLAELLERDRVTVWYSVPTALVQLSLRGELEGRDLSALRWILFAGETFPEKHLGRLRRQLPKARFSHVYGSTEVNVCTYYHLDAAGPAPTPLPIGRACSTTLTRVVGPDLQQVEDGEEGELLVRGTTVMSGYWGDPKLNRRALVRLPVEGGLEETFFRTGDRVRRLPNGDLTFAGRSDRQIKVRGHRVELEEVEAALLSLREVDEAAAFPLDDDEGSSSIAAAVISRGNIGEAELRQALRRVLPPHAVPDTLRILESLPRTPTGKVDRRSLRAGFEVPAEAAGG